jgi:hypothetical protein
MENTSVTCIKNYNSNVLLLINNMNFNEAVQSGVCLNANNHGNGSDMVAILK